MKKNGLKILIPILSFGKAGGVRVLSQLANNWKRLGADVNLLAFDETSDPYYPVDVNIIYINTRGKRVVKSNQTFNARNSGIKRMTAIYRYLKKYSEEFDIVLANSNLSAWPVYLASKSTNFYYIQAYEVEFYSAKNLKGLLKKIVAYLTYFLPLKKIVNADIYKNYKNLHAENVIPPGLDFSLYYPREARDISDREFIVGCIGRVEEWKGSNDVAKAVKILHEKGLNIKFKVAFNPIDYNRYELVKPNGDQNLADFYRSLDVLVAPGQIQLGAVHYPVIEAMACKTPVITTGYYPANRDNAYIVPIRQPDAIAEAILTIKNSYGEAIKKAETAYGVISQFEWKFVGSRFLDIFHSELKEVKK